MATAHVAGERVLLAKPQAFMNLSGEPVGRLVRYYGLPIDHLLVIYDDMDLPLGRIRIRPGGRSGGHRGMQSIIETLATDAFPRVRIGIGRSAEASGASYVLGRFASEEEKVLAEIMARTADAVEVIFKEGIEAAMNRFNA
jgi:peptidyl-tRNA hydrolase, PTH1 family